ncbi:MAG: RHS repeat-associated core domain-containing protein [Lachnospiraceae bacterium]|nr:RHS repeat-associated core domain-containing protein [Lachnospiraceae bacterium]
MIPLRQSGLYRQWKKQEISENQTYYHYACDSFGSITCVIAGNEFGNCETNGDVNNRILCRYEYDAFGNTINEVEIIANRYSFTEKIHDVIIDMYYFMVRYYSTENGRFTQADTYHKDRLNLYAYAGNNLVKYVDPGGHDKKNALESGSGFIIDSIESPALKGSPYNTDVVAKRIEPHYVPNFAHYAIANLYNHRKMPKPDVE